MKSYARKTAWGAAIATVMAVGAAGFGSMSAQTATRPAAGVSMIKESDMREFLTYLSSDQLLGREVFTEGYGVASQYVADQLKGWGIKPGGDSGSYFQMVKFNDVKTVSDGSSITVEVAGQTRIFKNGEGVKFKTPVGGKQTITLNGAEFLGYALNAPQKDDYAGKSVKGKAVVWVGLPPPDAASYGNRLIGGRAAHAVEEAWAAASISYDPAAVAPPAAATAAPVAGGGAGPAAPASQGRGARMLGNIRIAAPTQGDIQTVQDLSP